jgi:alkanesulfonate monooxygenase SsuD/methylene tetrahydromethanopterin reductase-like flavin-dependent oxidoreductase (luciferase family)
MRVAVARNVFVAQDEAEKREAIGRQARVHERLLSLSRGSESRPAHILAYADTPGRDAHSLIGTAAEVTEKLLALQEMGVAYVLLFSQGSRPNLRRFAEQVMPRFPA